MEESHELELVREQSYAWEYTGLIELALGNALAGLQAIRKSFLAARRISQAFEMQIELHRWLAELWIEAGNRRRASFHLSRARQFSTQAAEAEDVFALDRLALLLSRQELDGAELVEALSVHANKAISSGFGFEALLTAHSAFRVAVGANLPPLASEWWARTEFLAEQCGAEPLLERWRKEREEAGFLQPHPAGDDDEIDDPAAQALEEAPPPPVDLARYGIITRSAKLYKQAVWIDKLAPTLVPVLVQGQSGTGKELFARLVHDLSPRKDGPFLAINCGALPADIIESELFGHRRGAFTGALADKLGLFQEAHRGTLFLDEVGEMSFTAQAKLLRVLESGELRPVGSTRYEKVDVRIVAATNVDLERAAKEGRFRKDLFFRLRGLEIFLPPLRERLGDIQLLAQYFLNRINQNQGKHQRLEFETVQWLMGRPWPGNIRELKLAVQRASAMADEDEALRPEHFIGLDESQGTGSLPDELEEIERARVENALEASEWNTTAAARLLGMSRTTLAGRIKKLGIAKPRKR